MAVLHITERRQTSIWFPTLNLGHNKKTSDTDIVQAEKSARNEWAKARQKRQQESALQESEAKVVKHNEEGDTIENFAFDASLIVKTTDTAKGVMNESGDVDNKNSDLSQVASKLEEFTIVDISTKRNKSEMTESSTQR